MLFIEWKKETARHHVLSVALCCSSACVGMRPKVSKQRASRQAIIMQSNAQRPQELHEIRILTMQFNAVASHLLQSCCLGQQAAACTDDYPHIPAEWSSQSKVNSAVTDTTPNLQ